MSQEQQVVQVQDQLAQTQSVQAQPTEVVQYVPAANDSPKQMVKNVEDFKKSGKRIVTSDKKK